MVESHKTMSIYIWIFGGENTYGATQHRIKAIVAREVKDIPKLCNPFYLILHIQNSQYHVQNF